MSLIHKADICDLNISTPLKLIWLILPQTQVKGFTPKPNSLVSMKLHNYGEGVKIKKVWKQKPIQTKSTTSLTAITSY